MEPTIYKPGAYKTPGIYKNPGIYKGNGVYNDGAIPPLSEMLFYTDFSNYDNFIDVPQVGEECIYKNGLIYIENKYNTGGPFNEKYMDLYTYSNYPLPEKYYKLTRKENLTTFEFWIKQKGYSSSPYINHNDISIFTLDNLIHLQVSGTFTVSLYNGTTFYIDQPSVKIIKTTSNFNGAFVHCAIVNNKGSFKFFTDGILRAEFTRSEINLKDVVILQGMSNVSRISCGYISVRAGDKSNGTSFPVPNEPYM